RQPRFLDAHHSVSDIAREHIGQLDEGVRLAVPVVIALIKDYGASIQVVLDDEREQHVRVDQDQDQSCPSAMAFSMSSTVGRYPLFSRIVAGRGGFSSSACSPASMRFTTSFVTER